MAREKRTIARDSVFRSSKSSSDKPTQGIENQQVETFQTAVWLGDDEVEWLDRQCQKIKRSGWRSITRSAFIRSLIRAAMEQSVELSGVSGETELAQRLLYKES